MKKKAQGREGNSVEFTCPQRLMACLPPPPRHHQMWGVQWDAFMRRSQGREEAWAARVFAHLLQGAPGTGSVWPLGALWNLNPMPTQQTLPPRGAPGAPALPLSHGVTLGQSLTLLSLGRGSGADRACLSGCFEGLSEAMCM